MKAVEWTKGYVTCSLNGKYIELFINMAIERKLHIWNFKMVGNQSARFSISLSDFFQLKPILKKTYTRVHVLERNGLPFIFGKLMKRKGIIFGTFFFFLLIYFFSSMIWTISITGNNKISDYEVYQAVNEVGIHRGMFKFQLPKNKEIQNSLQSLLTDTAWIGVKVKGTQISITIVEKVKPENEQAQGPRHIISSRNAVISKILAEDGLPLVKRNDRVKKGDILISGVMGVEENLEKVAAKGMVEGVVWYETKVTIPMKQQWKEYTGNYVDRKYLALGNRMVKYKGYGDLPFEDFEKDINYKRITWRNYQLPIVFVSEKLLEYNEREKSLTKQEAMELAYEQARKDLFLKAAKDSKIINEKVLHQNIDSGKLTVKVLFEVLEDITKIQPIQGD